MWGGHQKDKAVIARVYHVIVGNPSHSDQFPYSWQAVVLTRPPWLRACLEENCRVMLAWATATSKCRPKEKKPILPSQPEDTPPPYAPIYLPLPRAPEQLATFSEPLSPSPHENSLGSTDTPSSLTSVDSLPPLVLTPYGLAGTQPKAAVSRGEALQLPTA